MDNSGLKEIRASLVQLVSAPALQESTHQLLEILEYLSTEYNSVTKGIRDKGRRNSKITCKQLSQLNHLTIQRTGLSEMMLKIKSANLTTCSEHNIFLLAFILVKEANLRTQEKH